MQLCQHEIIQVHHTQAGPLAAGKGAALAEKAAQELVIQEGRLAGGESALPPEAGENAALAAKVDKNGAAGGSVAASSGPGRAVKSGTGLSRFLAAASGDDDDESAS